MLRTKWYAAALIAVAAVLVIALPTASASTSSGHRIRDSFNGATIDPNVWAYAHSNDPAVSITQANGALTFAIGANASNDFDAGAATRCSASGDFDARLTFQPPQWTPDNGVWVSLNTNTNGFNAYRASWQYGSGDQYGAYLPPSGGGNADATGSHGTLRLTRTGDTWTGYYRQGSSWVSLGSGPGPTDPIQFIVGVFNLSGVLAFSGNPTTVSLEGFRVTAAGIVC